MVFADNPNLNCVRTSALFVEWEVTSTCSFSLKHGECSKGCSNRRAYQAS